MTPSVKRISVWQGALLVILLVGSSARPLCASPFPTSGQFDQVTTIVAPRIRLSFVQSISFKGANIRVDKTDLSQLIPLTQIETSDTMYFYSVAAGTGEQTPINEKLPPLLDRMDADTKTKLKGAIKTGSDKYEGYSCDTYTTSDQKGAEQIKFWVSTDPSFPFTLKTVATDKTLNKVTTVDLENIGLNVKLDDSTFEVPKNIKMETTPAVKKGDGSGSPAPAAPAAQDSAGSGH